MQLILGRDRVGICPLHWSRQGDWLVDGVLSRVRRGACAPPLRLFYEMALCAVVGTQPQADGHSYRLCDVRGPEGILVAPAEKIS